MKEVKKEETSTVVEVNKNDDAKTSTRLLSIDRFRGLCMFLMVCSFVLPLFSAFDFLAPIVEHGANGFQVIPGVSFADLFAPMFIFVIGLTMVKSFKKREEKFGTRQAYFQIAIRFLGLIGLGALLNGFENAWVDVILGNSTFAELSVQLKIYAVGFWIAIALLIVLLVSRFIKNDKFKMIAERIFKYFIAFIGICNIFFILVATAEKITPPVDGSKFGGWEWDTLQNIGLAGLIALPFVKFDKWGKLIMVGIIATTLSIMMQNGLFPLANSILEGGIIGGFSWASILMLGSIFAELKDDNKYWVLSSLLLLISVVLIFAFDYTAAKRGCTPVYALFTASIASMIWSGLNALNNFKPKFDFLAIWGSNAILTYLVNYVLAVFVLGGLLGEQIATLPAWAGVLIAIAYLALFSVGNWLLRRKNTYIRI